MLVAVVAVLEVVEEVVVVETGGGGEATVFLSSGGFGAVVASLPPPPPLVLVEEEEGGRRGSFFLKKENKLPCFKLAVAGLLLPFGVLCVGRDMSGDQKGSILSHNLPQHKHNTKGEEFVKGLDRLRGLQNKWCVAPSWMPKGGGGPATTTIIGDRPRSTLFRNVVILCE